MFKMTIWLAGAVLFGNAALAAAETPQQYCNELYPADAYEAAERSLYIKECVRDYTDDSDTGDYGSSESSQDDPAYYDGTVEDFVNDIPQDQN